MSEQGQHAPAIHHCLEMLPLPLHLAATMGWHWSAWVGAAALILYVGLHIRQFALARRSV